MKIDFENKEENIDWSKPQLLVCKTGTVVLTTGKHDKTGFEGLKVGTSEFCNGWSKKSFKLFKGTISND
ncbi:MAG: hypothetical protein FGM14_15065 [Flavobacteriales bacterium]|nr:hypothetical protein [Flavobacteriales bacterium]